MKNIFIIVLLISISLLVAEKAEFNFSNDTNLIVISEQANIPVKKIVELLDLDDISDYNKTISELDISNQQINKAIEEFTENRNSFYAGVALVGMSIVFGSLIVIGLVIASLEHINFEKKPKKQTVQTSIGKVTSAPEHLSSNGIIAAITAMYLHEMEVEEKNKLHLTWKRQPLSMWRATNMIENRFFDNKRG